MALWTEEKKQEAVRTNNMNALRGPHVDATSTSQQQHQQQQQQQQQHQQHREREREQRRPTQKNQKSRITTAVDVAKEQASPTSCTRTNQTKTAPTTATTSSSSRNLDDDGEQTPTPTQAQAATRARRRRRSSATQRSGFLEAVAAMMGPSKNQTSTSTSTSNNSKATQKKTHTTTATTTATHNIQPGRQVDESSGATQPPPRRVKNDKDAVAANARATTAATSLSASQNAVFATHVKQQQQQQQQQQYQEAKPTTSSPQQQQQQQRQPVVSPETAKTARSKPRKAPPSDLAATAVPFTTEEDPPPEPPSSIQFLHSLEVANQDRKQHSTKNMKTKKTRTNHNHITNTNNKATPTQTPTDPIAPKVELGPPPKKFAQNNSNNIKKNPLQPKLSAARQRIIQAKLEEQRAAKAAAKIKMSRSRKYLEDDDVFVNDDELVKVDWFSIKIQKKESIDNDTTTNMNNLGNNIQKPCNKQPTKLKQLRSTVEYSYPRYEWTTRQDMEHDGQIMSYRTSIGIRKRRFDISNLFLGAEPQRWILSRVYQFDVTSLQAILDRKHDKWWIQSRLPLYVRDEQETTSIRNNYNNYDSCKQFQQLQQTMQKDDKLLLVEDQEQGWEVLSIFFGDNEIDRDYLNDNTNNDDNDSTCHFSVAVSDVDSVNFSDNDDFYSALEESFNGKPREKVEVMPGDFTILRKEEETYYAISKGNYMSSLCLGCGTALVSVQDALQVACPTCGSITPLNGICLHRPFGIATGVKRSKCEHLLGPRKSPFIVAAASEGDSGDDKKPEGRKVAVTSYVRRSRTSISTSTGMASSERAQIPMTGTSNNPNTTTTTSSPSTATATTTTSAPSRNSIPSPTAASPTTTTSDRRRAKENRKINTSSNGNSNNTNRLRSSPPTAASDGAVRARPSSKAKTTLLGNSNNNNNNNNNDRGSTGSTDNAKTRSKSKRVTKPGAVHAVS